MEGLCPPPSSVKVSAVSSDKPADPGDQTCSTRLRTVKMNDNYANVLPIPSHLLSDLRMESPPPLGLLQG